jgi:AcrR family transcriptional regulator
MHMSRPSEYTRNSIVKAAVALFAERGYDGTSIRAIVSKARVNQAAINYHFKGKEGLYFEVLKVAFEGYLRLDNFDPERLKNMPREEALRQFVHQQLRPLLARDQTSRYCTHLRLGERPTQHGADQVRQDGRHAVSRQRHRARAAFPSARNFGPGRHVRCHLADGSMQRVRT